MQVTIEYNKKNVDLDKQEEKQVNIGATYTEQLLANDYLTLKNKPKIENVELEGNKNFEDLGLSKLSNLEIENLIKMQV